MDSQELRAAVGKPQVQKLKELGTGIRVAAVLGRRVLVKTVIPFTDADRVEKAGLLYVPEAVKQANTPLPSTGIIVEIGAACTETDKAYLIPGGMVMFSKYAGSDFILDEQSFRILEVPEILAVLDAPENLIAPVVEDYDERV